MARAIGIDLGTTNSAMAVMEGGEPVVIPNAEGGRTTLSVIAINKAGERLVGQVAKRQGVTNPVNTIFSIKRLMGRRLDDEEVQRDLKILPYKIDAAENGDARVWMGERSYSPPELSAMILQKLKADAEAYLGDEVTEADIASLVAQMTGIPVDRMMEGEADKLLHMEEVLHGSVIGQEAAISALSDAIRRARSGMKDPRRPIGSFIFVGPIARPLIGSETAFAQQLIKLLFPLLGIGITGPGVCNRDAHTGVGDRNRESDAVHVR